MVLQTPSPYVLRPRDPGPQTLQPQTQGSRLPVSLSSDPGVQAPSSAPSNLGVQTRSWKSPLIASFVQPDPATVES